MITPIDFEETEAMLKVDILRIEGLPDMDYRSLFHGNRAAVDPYVRIRLGKEEIDNKKWKERNNANPVFNHRLCIRYSHPSIADNLLIEVLDADPGRDDVIAVQNLPIVMLAPP